MEIFRQRLSKLPQGLLSGLTLLAILWLTLAPKPLGEQPPPLFEGADKLAHAIMFGGFAVMLLLDWQRKHLWKAVKIQRTLAAALVSSGLGIAIEFVQASMGFGRSLEVADMIADTSGAFLASIFWITLQKYWIA